VIRKFFEMNFAADEGAAPGAAAPAGGTTPAVSAAGQGNQTADSVGFAPAAMPEGFPAQFWDDKSGAPKMPDFVASYNELVTAKTAHEEKIKALPTKAEDYKLDVKLPQDLKLPDGLDIADLKVDDNDPRVGPLRELALKHQLPQEVIDELIALDAQTQIAAFTKHDELLQAEMKKLGENGKARVSAMESFLQKQVSPAQYEAMRPFIGDAEAFAGLEALITKITSQTNVPGAQPPQANKPATLPVEARWYGGAGTQQKAS
jgi:hypothetical protein